MAHEALIERFYAAYAARDAQAAAALYTQDGWHEETAMAKRREGHEALARALQGFWQMLPDVAWRRQGYIRAGQQVAVPYQMTAVFTGKDGRARPICLDGLHLFEIRDGLIAGSRDLWDLDLFKAQISADPAQT